MAQKPASDENVKSKTKVNVKVETKAKRQVKAKPKTKAKSAVKVKTTAKRIPYQRKKEKIQTLPNSVQRCQKYQWMPLIKKS